MGDAAMAPPGTPTLSKPSFDEFLLKFQGNKGQIGGPLLGLAPEHWKQFKALVALVDFGCHFDECGLCARWHRARLPDCCIGERCPWPSFVRYVTSLDDLKAMYEKWDPVRGFITARGCALPHELRSNTCLLVTCEYCDLDRTDLDAWELFRVLNHGFNGVDIVYRFHLKRGEKFIPGPPDGAATREGKEIYLMKVEKVLKRLRTNLTRKAKGAVS